MFKNILKEFIFACLIAVLVLVFPTAVNLVYSTTSNYKTFTDGSVLTAGELNSLQTNYTNADNAILDGDTFTGNMQWYSGTDIIMFSDTGSTTKAKVDGATGAAILGLTHEGEMTNCEMSVVSTTFTVRGYGAQDLSATNPCVIAIRSNTAGRVTLAYFTANVTVTFGATSDTDGNLFGVESSQNWASTMPFFIGVVYDGTTPYLIISRIPRIVTGSASTDVCQKGDTDCDLQDDVMILTTGLTLSAWVDLPITQVGWFDATFATASTAWTFALTGKNGFNDNYETVKFTFPVSQNGAASGTYLLSNGGTSPVFTSNVRNYFIKKDGTVTEYINHSGDGGTDGSGAVDTKVAMAYDHYASTTYSDVFLVDAVGFGIDDFIAAVTTDGFALSELTTGTNITHSSFSNGARSILGQLRYNVLQ